MKSLRCLNCDRDAGKGLYCDSCSPFEETLEGLLGAELVADFNEERQAQWALHELAEDYVSDNPEVVKARLQEMGFDVECDAAEISKIIQEWNNGKE